MAFTYIELWSQNSSAWYGWWNEEGALVSSASPIGVIQDAADADSMIEIRDFLLRRKKTIAAIAAAVFILAVIHVMLAVPQFTTDASLYLGDAQNTPTAAAPESTSDLSFLSNDSNADDIETQIELITSKDMVNQAILETGLNTQIAPSESSPMRFWKLKFFSGRSLGEYTPDSSSLEALYASSPGNFTVQLGSNGSYRLLTRGNWLRKPVFILAGVLGQPAAGNGVEVLLKPVTAGFQDIPGKTYNLQIVSPSVLADALMGSELSVTTGGTATQPSKIMFLKLQWQNPYQAKVFINQIMQDFISTRLSWKTEAASSTERFLAEQLTKVSASLAEADKKLALYQSQTKIVNVPLNAEAAVTAISSYQAQRTSLVLQQEALQQLADELGKTTGSLDPYLASQTDDPVLAKLTNDLSDAEVTLTDLLSRFTANSRSVQSQAEQIATLQSSIKIIVGNDLAAAAKHLTNLNEIIGGLQDQINALPAESLKVISLQRSSDVLGQLYISLLEKEETVEVSKAGITTNTRVIAPAVMPTTISSPNPATSLSFALLAGLILGVGIVLGKRTIAGRYDSTEEVRNAVRLPIFATISKPAGGAGKKKMPLSEDFRLLRSRIYRSLVADKPAVVTVVAAADDLSTATIGVNLAKSLADNGKRVLLVDANLNEASLSTSLLKPRDPGLSDWLETGRRVEFLSLPDEKFRVLPAGKCTFEHDDVFNEKNLTDLFMKFREEFDFVILISPSLPKSADGLTLGYLSDLILSVISLSQTSRRGFAEHSDLINSLERPHGIIVNSLICRDHPRAKTGLNADVRAKRRASVSTTEKIPVAPWKLHLI